MKELASAVADILRAAAGQPKKKCFTSAIIVAGGSGTRVGGDITKQLLEIDGIPVVVRSMLAFESSPVIDEIVVAAREDELKLYPEFREKYRISKLRAVTAGGSTRQESVLSAFKKVSSKSEFVAIHDAARCCITPEMIELTAREAYKYGAAAAGSKATDTIKVDDGKGFIESTVDREKVWLVSTPQIIKTDVYRACAYTAREKGISVTDDCGLLEAYGFKIKLCDVGTENIKITRPCDIETAQNILARRREAQK